jgi:hypothetical protein
MNAENAEIEEIAYEMDLDAWSKQFAERVGDVVRKEGIDLDRLADLSSISKARLEELLSTEHAVLSGEVQILGVILGIGVDELFPLPDGIPQSRIHEIFESLYEQGVGLLAATGKGLAEGPADVPGNGQESFERSIVQLHHCAECLSKLPSE